MYVNGKFSKIQSKYLRKGITNNRLGITTQAELNNASMLLGFSKKNSHQELKNGAATLKAYKRIAFCNFSLESNDLTLKPLGI